MSIENELSPSELAGVRFLEGGNEKMRAVIEAVIARQQGSIAMHRRAASSLSGIPSLLAFEAPMLPVCVEHAFGSRIVDVDGNEYLDCHMAYTATVLGHEPPEVARAVRASLDRGVGGGHFFAEQVELAELVKRMVPGVDAVSFFHTGGEAIQASVRMAKAATRNQRVAKFEGCYHGSNEIGLHNTWMILSAKLPTEPVESIPPSAATGGVRTGSDSEFLILPFNSPVAFELLRKHRDELACVVVDPIPPFIANWPDESKRFVADLAATARESGVPVIYDEVVCGFRLAKGGAREWAGEAPQMSCYGKIVSGLGVPFSIVAGEDRFLGTVRTNGLFADYGGRKAWLASTLSSSFIPVLASLAQLRYLDSHYDEIAGRLDRNHAELSERLAHFARESGIPVALQGHPRLQMQLSVGKQEPEERTYRGMMKATSMGQFRSLMAMTFYLRLNGVYTKLVPSMNLSAAHTDEDIEKLAGAIGRSLQQMERDGMLSY
jgi:glutamate-1-semialdehyde 2,1-aminomutase